MAFYLVRAKPKKERLETLKEELNSDKISRMRPFGKALQYSLENARIDVENRDYALWIEEDYCSPPLAMEREAVLDRYFNDISVEHVESEEEAWDSINDKPRLWGKDWSKNVNSVATRKNPSEPLFGINITPTANAADNAFEIVNHVKRYTLMFSRLGHEKRRRSKGKES